MALYNDDYSVFDVDVQSPVMNFTQGNRVEVNHFSFEVPDDWIIHLDYKGALGDYDLLAVQSDFHDDEAELGLTNRFQVSSRPFELGDSTIRLPEIAWALHYHAAAQIASVLISSRVDWNEQIEGLNTTNFVYRSRDAQTPNQINFYICPYMIDSFESIHILAQCSDEEDVRIAQNAAIHIAKSMRVNNPIKNIFFDTLDSSKVGSINSALFMLQVMVLIKLVSSMNGQVIEGANLDYRQNCIEINYDDYLRLCVEKIAELHCRDSSYMDALIAIYNNQKKFGNSDAVLTSCAQIATALCTLYPSPSMFGEEYAEKVAGMDALDPDGRMAAASMRAEKVFGNAYHPVNLNRIVQSDIAIDSDFSDNPEADMDQRDSVCDRQDGYESWWQSTSECSEPEYYVNPLGNMDLFALGWLYVNDLAFTNKKDIIWDGKHHSCDIIRLHTKQAKHFPLFAENKKDYIDKYIEALDSLDADEGLIVPREYVNPVTLKALPEGDVTGISLFNLLQCNRALQIIQDGAHSYIVYVDPRVATGIPDFHKLMGRMIWDIRDIAGISHSFDVDYVNVRNFDANKYFGNNGFLERHALGVTSPYPRHFEEKPEIVLPNFEDAKLLNDEFESGLDNPEEFQKDEELFYITLSNYAEELPITTNVSDITENLAVLEELNKDDEVVLISDWTAEGQIACKIDVYTSDRKYLGSIAERSGSLCDGHRALACLLPYITAQVETVKPKRNGSKAAKSSILELVLYFDSTLLQKGPYSSLNEEIKLEAKKLLKQPRDKRSRESRLNGIVHSSAPRDTSNKTVPDVDLDSKNIAKSEEIKSFTVPPKTKKVEKYSTLHEVVKREKDLPLTLDFRALLNKNANTHFKVCQEEVVTKKYFIKTCELMMTDLQASRQDLFDTLISGSDDDAVNLTILKDVFALYNVVFFDSLESLQKVIDCQLGKKCNLDSIESMINEINEAKELITDSVDLGQIVIDSISIPEDVSRLDITKNKLLEKVEHLKDEKESKEKAIENKKLQRTLSDQNVRKEKIETQINELEKVCNELSNKIANQKEKIDACGLFKRAQKKELSEELYRLNSEYDLKKSELEETRQKFESTVRSIQNLNELLKENL